MNKWLRALAAIAISVVAFSVSAKTPPNIVLIVADDLGIGDIGTWDGGYRVGLIASWPELKRCSGKMLLATGKKPIRNRQQEHAWRDL